MSRRLVEAQYEWNWSSLVGSVQGLLRALGLPFDAAQVSAALGDAFRVDAAGMDETPAFRRTGYQVRPLASLPEDLAALGLEAQVEVRHVAREGPPSFWRRRRLRRRIKGRLDRGTAVVAYRAGLAEFGLIVGYDDDRGSYRVQGPFSDEVGPWVAYDDLWTARGIGAETGEGVAGWLAVVLAGVIPADEGAPRPEQVLARACRHALSAQAPARLERWAALLEGDADIDPPGHAYWVQALASARGEAARFWRAAAGDDGRLTPIVEAARREALTLSRFATLYPYPAGGDVEVGGARAVGARTLRDAIGDEREVVERLRGIDVGP